MISEITKNTTLKQILVANNVVKKIIKNLNWALFAHLITLLFHNSYALKK